MAYSAIFTALPNDLFTPESVYLHIYVVPISRYFHIQI
jgi:hypothetical protein